ncbi:phosphohydrolase [Chromobacterium haemolyticum]|uniref:Phosphohydrolase n=1 Tax=Chromobacterium haemolyticum TaxID=394935 RepID=A0ABS3GR89_9NEIS|nr:HD domain-containing phosphohydrolase [Chromobacterium haemolyticum]MBK0416305.1 phosphohydrolase [Chromobacterium haemolyticum]MBO0417551.1 phosphohydrolase [Chromobacterium haemolyticum]MBO0500691.1 phosphohydrolase [Chromobacterium haemolyticum]OQS31740.1 phosphohydrolase [Chromobacterium haemolyticum]QOD81070.1 phosphohydrolase [Chromobacterium haemolyticum]
MPDSSKVKLPTSFLRIGQQLPVDVYAKNGLLLLKKGHYVLTPEQRERLVTLAHGDSEEVAARLEREQLERAAQREKEAAAQVQPNPIMELGFQTRRAEGLLLHGLAVPGLAGRLADMADALIRLACKQPDGVLASVLLTPYRDIGSAHSVHVAAIMAVLGRRLGMEEARLQAVVGAALSMNLAITGLLNQLSRQQTPPDAAQRDDLYAHPIVGSAILREAGVVDEHWHLLVQTHQEQRGGDGYPQGLRGEDIHPDAALLHMVDVLCSCIHQPQPALPALVIGSLYRGELGDFDPQHAALLIKELGVYPPGSFVKLASNEIGVVTHRSDKANAPRVAALRKLDGAPYADALLRDTRQNAYRVLEAAPLSAAVVKPAYLSKLWQK